MSESKESDEEPEILITEESKDLKSNISSKSNPVPFFKSG